MIFYNLIMPGPILIPVDSVYLYQTVIKCLLRKRKRKNKSFRYTKIEKLLL